MPPTPAFIAHLVLMPPLSNTFINCAHTCLQALPCFPPLPPSPSPSPFIYLLPLAARLLVAAAGSRFFAAVVGACVVDGRGGRGVHGSSGGRRRRRRRRRRRGRGARHPGLPRRLHRHRRRRQGSSRQARRRARQGDVHAEARVPADAQRPEPVPRRRAVPSDGGGVRHDDVPQRVHDREGEDGAGAVRAREAGARSAAQRRRRRRRSLPVVVLRHHVLREAPRRRRRGTGRRLRLPVRRRRRRRHGGRGVPQVLPLRAHLPE